MPWGFLPLHGRLLPPFLPLQLSGYFAHRDALLLQVRGSKYEVQKSRLAEDFCSFLLAHANLPPPFSTASSPESATPEDVANFSSSGIVVVARKFMCAVVPFWDNLDVKIAAVLSGSLRVQSTPWLGSCAPSSTVGGEISLSPPFLPPIPIHVTQHSSRIG